MQQNIAIFSSKRRHPDVIWSNVTLIQTACRPLNPPLYSPQNNIKGNDIYTGNQSRVTAMSSESPSEEEAREIARDLIACLTLKDLGACVLEMSR